MDTIEGLSVWSGKGSAMRLGVLDDFVREEAHCQKPQAAVRHRTCEAGPVCD